MCDELCIGSPVSISSDSQVSEGHKEDPGQCDELLHTNSSSADVCDAAGSSITPFSNRLPCPLHVMVAQLISIEVQVI